MPGHLARRFQQIAVAVFHAEASARGSDLTPVQYAALVALETSPGIDQVTLSGLIAYDRTTIAGVVDRLVRKGYVDRKVSRRDRRASELYITEDGLRVLEKVEPGVDAAQRTLLSGLTESESKQLIKLLRKAIMALNESSRAPMRSSSE